MAAKALEEALERVANWPEEAQRELAEIALEIDAELSGGVYHATADELEGIDRGLKEAREGRFASEGGLRETAAGMKVVYTQEALADLDAILEFISSHYPGVYAAFERRIQALRRALAHGRRAPRRSSSGRLSASCLSFAIPTKHSAGLKMT
jgi:plasmid stabilization system protein ParE